MGIETSTLEGAAPSGKFYDKAFISEYGRLESLRAGRYNTCYSILLIDMEGLEDESVYRKLARVVSASVRSCDVAGRGGENRILVILPETDYFAALLTIKKLGRALEPIISASGGLSVIFSHATFPRDGKGFDELLARAASLVKQKRASMWETTGMKDRIFWEIIAGLASEPLREFHSSNFDAGAGMALSEFIVDQVNELIVNEVSRAPQQRGILYIASKKISAALPIIRTLGQAGNIATRVFLVGEAGGDLQEIKNATPVPLNDPRLKELFFTFYLSEDAGYAVVYKEAWGDTLSCFHTADKVVVEGLITKFQSEYALGEQLG